MSLLFTPKKIGTKEIGNRFVHSATYEGMARETGEVTEQLIRKYRMLARGEVGLIIPGLMYIDPLGRGVRYQTGIHCDAMIPGLKNLVRAIHDEGGTVFFQIAHSGQQTSPQLIGRTPLGPSRAARDPVYFFKPRAMTDEEIQETTTSFGAAAQRAVAAGADGIQIHAAHGYLLNQFLSPFFNKRTDAWGGTTENRFRLLREVILEVKSLIPEGMPLIVKLNADDHTPREGITPELAVEYARKLAALEIDALEISCGTLFSYMNMCRGDVPVEELVQSLPAWKKPLAKIVVGRLRGKYNLVEAYNREAAVRVKPVIGDIPLILVGGMRSVAIMNDVLERNHADFISLSRPFLREPNLVRKIHEGKTDCAACVSCNRCFAAIANDLPVLCYCNGYPSRQKTA